MDVPALLDELAADGPLLADAAERAGLAAPVPACPDWTVRDLVVHIGGVHRWATDIVATAGTSFETAAGGAVGTGPGDAELLDWFREGHATLVDTLRAAPDDLDCATFLAADSPRQFWARRQAHETAMHRVDAETASGGEPVFDAAFAQDGIGEILHGFAARKREPAERAATIALRASDGPSWLVTLGGERVEAEPVGDPADADLHLRGSSSDLYRWLWNRPSQVQVTGDAAAAQLWATTVRVRWS